VGPMDLAAALRDLGEPPWRVRVRHRIGRAPRALPYRGEELGGAATVVATRRVDRSRAHRRGRRDQPLRLPDLRVPAAVPECSLALPGHHRVASTGPQPRPTGV
jgi:hypothetical protein